ncbi:MAG TPA: stage II sporulation protein M, partial [Streptosporangiaceae bacterium]|nr:stage II sporulation protein M [Streptosporangiaceae bacterium]
MDIDAFEAAHRAQWQRLDTLVRRRRRLSGPEVDELVDLYQRTTTDLSSVRSAGHDPVLAAQLSTRVARARSAITGSHTPSWDVVTRFLVIGFPAAAYRARWWWLASALGSIVLGVVVAWWIARSPGLQT